MPEALQNISNIAILIGILLTAVGGYGSYYFGKKVEEESSAKAHETEKLLNSKIENLSQTAKSLETRLDPFEKLATTLYPNVQAEAALEKLRQDTLELRKRTEEMERRAQPRVITEAQMAVIVPDLKKISGWKIRVDAAMNDPEAVTFADALKTAFTRSGWQVDGVNQVMWDKPVRGAFLFAGGNPPEQDAYLATEALIGRGIPLKPVQLLDLGKRELQLRIGTKE